MASDGICTDEAIVDLGHGIFARFCPDAQVVTLVKEAEGRKQAITIDHGGVNILHREMVHRRKARHRK